jgi:hypothetical protein
MTLAASRYAASSYGTIHQHTWFQGQCKHLNVLLGTSLMHLHFEDSHLKTLNPRVKFFERFNSRVGMTPNRCTYAVPLFDQLDEKALNDLVP